MRFGRTRTIASATRGRLDGTVANREPDCHTAPAVEHGCEWIPLDRGFSMYSGLRFRNLLNA